jgi:hypothetical protein
VFIGLFFLTACSESSFTGTVATPQPGTANAPISPGAASGDVSDRSLNVEEAACLTRVLPVRVVFALDVSSSMTPDLRGVAQNVSAFASRLASVRFASASQGPIASQVQVELGMVAFTDNIVRRVDLTGPSQFAGQIAGLSVVEDQNTDLPEAGLSAVGEAARMLENASRSRGEGISVVVVVTDAMAHDQAGAPGARQCGVSALDAVAGMSAARRLAIYDASPDVTMVSVADRVALRRVPVTVVDAALAACAPYSGLAGSGPARQWADARARLFKNRKGTGSGLGFPFNAQNLISRLPSDLETTYRICGG